MNDNRQIKSVKQFDTSSTATNTYFDSLIDMNHLYNAYVLCTANVYWKKSVQSFEANLLSNLVNLRKDIINGTYKQKPFYEFDISERGKKRHIKALTFRDRVFQKALCEYVLKPLILPKLIYDSGAGIKDKGVRFSRERLVAHLQKYYKENKSNAGYILIGDFKNYYGSIVHHDLMMMVERLISDVRILNLIYAGISPYGDGVSLGLGSDSVTMLASLYATPIDNYCKIVRSCKYYGRHNDDFYIISSDIGFLKDMLTNIDRIATSMGLKLNTKKTQIYRIDKGFKYLQQKIILTETSRAVMIPNSDRIAAEKHKLKSLKKKGRPYDYIYKQYYDFRGSMLKYDAYYSIKSADKYFNNLFGKEITWKY